MMKFNRLRSAVFQRSINQLVIATLLLAVFAGLAKAADDSPAERRGVSIVRVTTAVRLPYLAITPVGFRQQSRWPLIVSLHGSDQSGNDLNRVKENGVPRYALNHPGFPFVVVAPLLPVGRIWEADAVATIVRQATRRFRIDPARVYLTGLSTGGYGTWSTALEANSPSSGTKWSYAARARSVVRSRQSWRWS